ncbi:hypothetical protein [Alicyclobacillus fastidiosus]|uniref:Uncharacterized protein n=1 Tax=Alicyclobacillus fastidiosus TaxID=392011 RepID=A0ABV5ABX5_9BACL|nr:hypothetical protein [Alicyclobacillus fastidiosus]WEH10270.1 hypothetical protein PYS47_03290 [Alicyclobacillus fastidiosus]
MATPSNYQKATRQLGRLSRKLANNLTFRKQFEDALTAAPAVRRAEMRAALKQNGIDYPFNITFNAPSATSPRVHVWARVMDPANNVNTNVGYTYRILS